MSLLLLNLLILFSIISPTLLSKNVLLPLPNLQFVSAKTEFKYAIMKENSTDNDVPERMVNLTDNHLMIAIYDYIFVGSAQLTYRYVPAASEQVVTINEVAYFLIKDGKVTDQKIKSHGFTYTSPNFGFLTLASNFLLKKLDVKVPSHLQYAQIKRKYIVKEYEDVIAVTLHKGKLETRKIKTLPFSNCSMLFDPEDLFTVDEDEQICTEQADKNYSDGELSIPSSLIFAKEEKDDKYILIGIESKIKEGVSLSTFVPYHCPFFEEFMPGEMCT